MQVVLSERVKTALTTLGRDDRERVNTWFGYLRNWDEDSFVRSRSVELDVNGETVYVFRTSTDVRIFYKVDRPNDTISVVDVATAETILSSGQAR